MYHLAVQSIIWQLGISKHPLLGGRMSGLALAIYMQPYLKLMTKPAHNHDSPEETRRHALRRPFWAT